MKSVHHSQFNAIVQFFDHCSCRPLSQVFICASCAFLGLFKQAALLAFFSYILVFEVVFLLYALLSLSQLLRPIPPLRNASHANLN